MIEELHMFALIVENSSMNKAANVLNISQPALSRRLAKLEEDIGVSLFDRVGKRLELTKVGQITYEYALELRQRHQQFMHSVAEFVHTERSNLTIGASLTTLQTTLPDIIQSLTTHHSNMDIKAITGKTHEIVSFVRDHKVDIGIVASSVDDPLLHSTPLFHDHLLLVVPRNLLQIPPEKFTMKDFNHLPMILFSKGTWYRNLTDELFEKYELTPEVKMEIDSFEAILRLLHTCRAATLLPRSYMRQQLLLDNELAVINMKELENTKRTTSLIHLSPDILNPSVQHWVKQIVSLFPTAISG